MLDDRQYRTDNPCGDGEATAATRRSTAITPCSGGAGTVAFQGIREVLRKVEHRRAATVARGARAPPYRGELVLERRLGRLPARSPAPAGEVVDTRLRNPVFLTGDWHSTFVNDLKLDFKDPGAQTVATEFVTPAITTGGDGTPYGPYYGPMIPYNPHIKYFEGDRRGYFLATVTRKELRLDLRFVTSVEDPNGTGYTERPG